MDLSKSQAELEIEKLELRDANAALRQDLDTIEKIWSDKLVVSGAANLLFSKAQVLAFFRAGLVRLKSFERRVTRVLSMAIPQSPPAATPSCRWSAPMRERRSFAAT